MDRNLALESLLTPYNKRSLPVSLLYIQTAEKITADNNIKVARLANIKENDGRIYSSNKDRSNGVITYYSEFPIS